MFIPHVSIYDGIIIDRRTMARIFDQIKWWQKELEYIPRSDKYIVFRSWLFEVDEREYPIEMKHVKD
jgi:hypothetical protein